MILTNTPANRALAHCVLPMAPVYRAGDSSAETVNKTEVRDMRVVGGEGSSNVSLNGGDNSTTNVTLTDHGAISGGLALGTQAIEASTKNAQGLQETTLGLYGGALAFAKDSNAGALAFVKDSNARALGAVQAAGEQVSSMASKVAGDLSTAFTDAKAPDKSILIVGGAIVVGLGALMVFARKG